MAPKRAPSKRIASRLAQSAGVPPSVTAPFNEIPIPPTVNEIAIPTGATPSGPTPDFSRLFAEHMAASMPGIISQLKDGLLQSMAGSNPLGGVHVGSGSGGSGLGGPEVIGTNVGGSGSDRMGGTAGHTVIPDNVIPRGCSLKTFIGCKPPEFRGTEGAVGTLQWLEKLESIFETVGCADVDRVKFAAFMFQGTAFTWWNSVVGVRGRDEINIMMWGQLRALIKEEYAPEAEIEKLEQELWDLSMQGSDIQGYTTRFYNLSQLVPHLVRPEEKRIGRYIRGLSQHIRGNVISSRPGTFQSAVEIATTLTHNLVRDGTLPPTEVKRSSGSKRNSGSRLRDSRKKSRGSDTPQPIRSYAVVDSSYQGKYPKCEKCGKDHHKETTCWVCTRCNGLGHTEKYCKTPTGNCFGCGVAGHHRNKCPKLITTGSGSGNASGSGSRGRVFVLGAQEAQQDPRVVTGG